MVVEAENLTLELFRHQKSTHFQLFAMVHALWGGQ
jgi:hypothetical protein